MKSTGSACAWWTESFQSTHNRKAAPRFTPAFLSIRAAILHLRLGRNDEISHRVHQGLLRQGDARAPRSSGRITAFYEKVIKVKADVAAVLD